MSLKVQKLPEFSLTAGLLMIFITLHAVIAQEVKQINCHSKLSSGKSYIIKFQSPYQQFQTQSVSGEFKITQVYKCPQGTCFQAQMKVDNLGVDSRIANGYWKASNIQFNRYVGKEQTTQIWSGQCLENYIQGQWYFPDNPNNRRLFTVTYYSNPK